MSIWHSPGRQGWPRHRTTAAGRPPTGDDRVQPQSRVAAAPASVALHSLVIMAMGLLGILVTLLLAESPAATTVGIVVSAVVVAVGWESMHTTGREVHRRR